jgi:hypothetical protein
MSERVPGQSGGRGKKKSWGTKDKVEKRNWETLRLYVMGRDFNPN